MATPSLRIITPTTLTAATGLAGAIASVLLYDEFEELLTDRPLLYQRIWAPAIVVIAAVSLIRLKAAASDYLTALGFVGLAVTVAIAVSGTGFGGHATTGWWCTATYLLASLHVAGRRR